MLPVQRDINGGPRQQLLQLDPALTPQQLLIRHHAPAQPQFNGFFKPVHGWGEVARVGGLAQPEVLQQKNILQPVFAVEDHGRRGQHAVHRQPTALPLHRGYQCGRPHTAVAHHAQRLGHATTHRPRQRGHAAQHVAAFQRIVGVILVIDDDVNQQAVRGQQWGHARQKPGGHAVGVDGHAQGLPRVVAIATAPIEALQHIGLHQPHLPHMGQQSLASNRGPNGFATHQQPLTNGLFQRLDAQRHRRQRHVQSLGSRLKAALLGYGGQGIELTRIEHGSP